MDMREYRESLQEKQRVADLLALIPAGRTALDVGARDGFISRLLTSSFQHVTALDLQKPRISHECVTAVAGDVTCLQYPASHFDAVICAEVLEHIPSELLQRACDEITRVARKYVLIGVPYKQDIRISRTKCYTCGKRNPPWGHVNVFDEDRLRSLFPHLAVERVSYVGENNCKTNWLSVFLMDLAGNPYGTYDQDEGCVFCGGRLKPPPERTLVQKVFTRAGVLVERIQSVFTASHPNWIHALLSKR